MKEDLVQFVDGGVALAGLSDIPAAVMKLQVLPRLDVRSLCALACAGSRPLRVMCDGEELWQPLAVGRSWRRRSEEETWKQAYRRLQGELCTCCRKPTKYIFTILGCRLCEACEHANPHKYSLVTACEASEHYGLTAADLMALTGPLKKLGTFFYLRCEVVSTCGTPGSTLHFKGEGTRPELSDDDSADDRDPDRPKTPGRKESKEERRAARKANKKQVKERKREKRLFGSSPPPASASGSYLAGSSCPTTPHGRKKPPSANSRRQPHVRHAQEVTEGPSMRSVSTCSSWIQERERLMSEVGTFGISGLSLACDRC
mmetsp:Transcript_40369/g.101554  ORF Transcript_40369/g.101554 Transcript_40369/m.101554 type:complete len:316 (-) Transcript_40369:187-1134(-)